MKIAIFFIMSLAMAEEAKSPEITVEEQRDWQRARADLEAARAVFTAADKAYSDKTNELLKKCGVERGLIKNAQGDPVCGAPAEKK